MLKGVPEQNWIGFEEIGAHINPDIVQFEAFQTWADLNGFYDLDFTTVNTKINELRTVEQQLINDFKDSTVKSPNPNDPNQLLKTDIIKSFIPDNQVGTVSYNFESEHQLRTSFETSYSIAANTIENSDISEILLES